MTDFLIVATKDGVKTFDRPSEEWNLMAHTLTAREVTSVAVRGNTLLAGTTGGVFRSDDMGQTWRSASAGMGTTTHIRRAAFHPQKPGVALVGTEPAAIFRTEDNAKSWEECPEVARLRDEKDWYLPYSPEAGCVRGFAFHGDRAYAAVEQGGLLRSDDGGQTWRLAEGSNGNPHEELPEGFIHNDVHSVTVHPVSPGAIFAPTGGGLYHSLDGDKRWVHLYDCYCRAVWIDPDDVDHMIFGPADGVSENGRIEVTHDGGRTWQPASGGLDTPWPSDMVEQFARRNDHLLAVLTNGQVIAAEIKDLAWHRVLPEVDDALALTVIT